MKKVSESHEALSLLFHRDGVPNVIRLKPTHNPPTWVKEACMS
jgi:hypothetical protein